VGPLPADLTGPVPVALAKAEATIPGPARLTGGSVYEPKWDGYRLVIVVSDVGDVALWSRQRKDLTNRFPDVATVAATNLPNGTVVDGEVVMWNGDRLDFDLLQQRLVTPPAKAAQLRRDHPASYVAFDLLAVDGADLRRQPWASRRRQLETVTTSWMPPLHLTPATSDVEEALMWFDELRPMGVEGLVVKGENSTYRPGKSDWLKVKNRQTTEVIVGAVIGRLEAPQAVVAGRQQDGGPPGRTCRSSRSR
jgi:ATP-dependent DNA ligase